MKGYVNKQGSVNKKKSEVTLLKHLKMSFLAGVSSKPSGRAGALNPTGPLPAHSPPRPRPGPPFSTPAVARGVGTPGLYSWLCELCLECFKPPSHPSHHRLRALTPTLIPEPPVPALAQLLTQQGPPLSPCLSSALHLDWLRGHEDPSGPMGSESSTSLCPHSLCTMRALPTLLCLSAQPRAGSHQGSLANLCLQRWASWYGA